MGGKFGGTVHPITKFAPEGFLSAEAHGRCYKKSRTETLRCSVMGMAPRMVGPPTIRRRDYLVQFANLIL